MTKTDVAAMLCCHDPLLGFLLISACLYVLCSETKHYIHALFLAFL